MHMHMSISGRARRPLAQTGVLLPSSVMVRPWQSYEVPYIIQAGRLRPHRAGCRSRAAACRRGAEAGCTGKLFPRDGALRKPGHCRFTRRFI